MNRKDLFNKTFNGKTLTIEEHRVYANKIADLANKLMDKILEDSKTTQFKKDLHKLFCEVTNGTKQLEDLESVVYAYLFNDNDNLNGTERYITAMFYMFIWLESEFPSLLSELKITIYTTELKVGSFTYPVEAVEFQFHDENMVIVDMDALDTVEFIIRKCNTKNPLKNVSTFNQPFDVVFLCEGMLDAEDY